MRKRLSKLSRLCDRYETSDRADAVISNAVLEDLGILSHIESKHVIDCYELRRVKESLDRMQCRKLK